MTTKNKLAGMDTMTTGKSTASFTPGQALTLHNELVSIIVTDPTETVVQYGNKAQRLFRTNDLSSYLDLGFFPSSTRFTRPVMGGSGIETAYVEHVTAEGYIMEVIGADGLEPDELTTMTYAQLMEWHMTGPIPPAERMLPGKLYVPKAQMPTVDASIAGLIKDLESEDDDQPFETDLQREVERLRKDLEAMEIRDQAKINDLTRQLREANADLLKQNDLHITELVAKNEEIERLEAKAAILDPVCKEYCMRFDISEAELNKLAQDGWQIQHMQFVQGAASINQLNVVFVRDLPASPAPKVAATDAAIYSAPAVPAYRPPVQSPPMPANQTIVGARVSRALTNNGPKPGETKRIPTLAQFEARKEANANEIAAILQRGADEQEALRRQFAKQSTHPFGSVQGVSPL